jgi:hypothetical protein
MSEAADNKRYAQMLGRIGNMIPEEFFETDYSTTEDAVALLLERYYSEMASKFYNENQNRELQKIKTNKSL